MKNKKCSPVGLCYCERKMGVERPDALLGRTCCPGCWQCGQQVAFSYGSFRVCFSCREEPHPGHPHSQWCRGESKRQAFLVNGGDSDIPLDTRADCAVDQSFWVSTEARLLPYLLLLLSLPLVSMDPKGPP